VEQQNSVTDDYIAGFYKLLGTGQNGCL